MGVDEGGPPAGLSAGPGPTRSEGRGDMIAKVAAGQGATPAQVGRDFISTQRPSSLIRRLATVEETSPCISLGNKHLPRPAPCCAWTAEWCGRRFVPGMHGPCYAGSRPLWIDVFVVDAMVSRRVCGKTRPGPYRCSCGRVPKRVRSACCTRYGGRVVH